jgi:hypothetical protein
MADDVEEFEKPESIAEVFAREDTLDSLIALRQFIAHELDGNRCKTCHMSQLKTGDQASLLLRAQKIIEDIETLRRTKAPVNDQKLPEGVTSLASIKQLRPTHWQPDTPDSDNSKLGTKAGTRRSGSGRRQSGQ